MQSMTSRERVWKAIRHQKTDRIPIDIGGTKMTGIHVDEYAELVRSLSLDLLPPKVYDQWQMLARVDETVMRWLHSDVIQLENISETWGLRNLSWKTWTTNSGNPVLMPADFNPVKDERGYLYLHDSLGHRMAVMAPDSLYFDKLGSTELTMGDFVFTDPQLWKQSIPLYSDEDLKLLETRARFYHQHTEYSIHGGCFKGGLGTGGPFAGHSLSDWLCLLVAEQDYAGEILHATAERAIENLGLYLQAVGPYIDTILVSATDFGTQGSEMFDPAIFKRLHQPNYKRINEFVHANCQAKTFFHSCGSIRNLIEPMIQAGVDILNPVQTSAAHMDPAELKSCFGDRIVFWGGGIDTQTVLPFGSPEACREQVLERLRIFGQGGGFVFSPIHNTQFGVPVKNIEMIVETVFNYGELSDY